LNRGPYRDSAPPTLTVIMQAVVRPGQAMIKWRFYGDESPPQRAGTRIN
jgi:hypothetical protein